ncbi:MAG TPA: antirestriction protein ArdA [Kiritimatiellia bacterium]|nr:antirestriction protein ArdA [Kiritimatiellia bacterium]HMP35004.1 antirestriction protein ArdA [Kiritimatiellia bacterium]
MNTTTTTPRVYVGTYAKYNNGSIEGAWIDLDDHDAETFRDACLELHKDEADPELMFQDFEGFPREFYGESYLDPRLWEWLEMDDDERDLLAAYTEDIPDGTLEQAQDAFLGAYDSPQEWAEEWLEQDPAFNAIPERLKWFFDFDAYAREAEHDGINFVQHEGKTYVFSR